MQLKLAEYKDKKFVGFLEQSKLEMKTFFDQEGGNSDLDILSNGFLLGGNYIQIISRDKNFDIYTDEYKLDEKDPLNRFEGLFDGITYGNGRFVLVKDDFDKMAHQLLKPISQEEILHKVKEIFLKGSPELWEKVK